MERQEQDNTNSDISETDRLLCRMYPNAVPEVGSFVIGIAVQLDDSAAIVELPEYGDLEAMIQFSDLNQKRIKNLRAHIQVDRTDVFEVIRVDAVKEYIDLSKKFVTAADRTRAMARFAKAKAIHSMVRQLVITQHLTMMDVYQNAIWPLYEKNESIPHDVGVETAYYKIASALENGIFAELFKTAKISKKALDQLEKFARQKFRKQIAEIHARIELNCFGPDGIDGIVAALRAGLAAANSSTSESKHQVHINLYKSPVYMLRIEHPDANLGKAALERAITAIADEIKKYRGGQMNISMSPFIGNTSEQDLEEEKIADRIIPQFDQSAIDNQEAENAPDSIDD